MAGTDRSKDSPLGGPAIVLVDPQLGENIGMVARAMLNCGLDDLRLVRPRDGWPSPAAEAAAAGADAVLDGARLYDTTEQAIAELNRVYAATVRARGMTKAVVTPRQAAAEMRSATARGERAGLLFGPERAGLNNDDMALADRVLEVPLNPGFASLNLAMAVLLVGYEWFQAGREVPPRRLASGGSAPAPKAELLNFLGRLEAALDEANFFFPAEKRPVMLRNLRNVFQRADLTDAELRSLHGVVSALSGQRRRGAPRDEQDG